MPLKQVMAPAIKLARDGFVLQQGDVNILHTRSKDFAKYPNVAKTFLNHGKPYEGRRPPGAARAGANPGADRTQGHARLLQGLHRPGRGQGQRGQRRPADA